MNSGSEIGKPVRLRERLREETAAAILAAAEAAFGEDGLHARMETIAARAGVAVGTVYNHFEDREALLADLAESRRTALLERLDAALAGAAGRPFEEQLRAFVRALFEHWAAHARLLAVLVQAELLGQTLGKGRKCRILGEMVRRADELVRRGVAERELRADAADIYAASLVGMARGVLLQEVERRGGEPPANHADAIVSLFLDGAGTGA